MDENISRQMPHSVEAEQAVIGSMLIDARCVPEVIGKVKALDFYVKANKDIFETIYSMFNYSMTIDPVTVLEQMRIAGTANEGTAGYLMELMEITPTAANVSKYAEIVCDKSLLRSVATVGEEVALMAYEGAGEAKDILEAAEKKIYALRQDRSDGLQSVSQILVGVYEQLAEAAQSDSRIPGLTTGLVDLDNFILGLNKSDLIIIASRPGMEKPVSL